MTTRFADVRRTLFTSFAALFVSAMTLSAAVLPSVAPLTAQPAL